MSRELEMWLQALDLVPQMIFLLDARGRVVRANQAVERWSNGRAGEVAGLTVHDVLHRGCEDPACYLAEFERQAAQALCAGSCVCHDGWDHVLQRRVTLRLERPREEHVGASEDIGAIAIVDDHAGRGAEEAARAHDLRSATMLHALDALDHVPAIIAMADAHGQVSYLNAAARAVLPLRVAGEQAGGTPRATDLRRIVPAVGMHEAQRKGTWSGLCVVATADGRTLERRLKIAAFRDEEGKVRGYTVVEPPPADVSCAQVCCDISEAGARYLATQQLAIQEAERRRIAADLHDGLGQSLALLKRAVDEASAALYAGSYEALGASLSQLAGKTQSALSELRRTAMNLRPSMLDDLGIVATLSWFCREFEISYPAIRLERDVTVREAEVPDAVKTAVFRILQEATNNAVKYSGSARIRMQFAMTGGELRLTIADEGVGFDPAAAAPGDPLVPRGLGLQTIRERAELTGGRCDIRTSPGEGVTIVVSWPTGRQQRRYIASLPRRTLRVIPTPRPARRREDDNGASRPVWLD